MKEETLKIVREYEEYFRKNPEEKIAYEQYQKFIHDYVSDMEEAEERGIEKGIEKARNEAKKEGRKKERQEAIQNMIKQGIPMQKIAEIYHMSEVEINKLVKKIMQRRRYPAIFHQNTDDGSFTVTFPDFTGCITEGKTRDEAIEMATDALNQRIEYMLDTQKDLPFASDSRMISIEDGEFIMLITPDIDENDV